MITEELDVETIDRRHGGPCDRGGADYYYWRDRKPHYYKGATYQSELVEEKDMTEQEIAEYNFGYDSRSDRKNWG